MPFWDEPGLLKSGIFSILVTSLSYRLWATGWPKNAPSPVHTWYKGGFSFYIFHSKIPLLCSFSTACEAQAISWLCTEYVEAERVHPVLHEFSEWCRYSPHAGAVCDPFPRQSLAANPWSGTSPSLRGHEPFPVPLLPQQKSALLFVCTGG